MRAERALGDIFLPSHSDDQLEDMLVLLEILKVNLRPRMPECTTCALSYKSNSITKTFWDRCCTDNAPSACTDDALQQVNTTIANTSDGMGGDRRKKQKENRKNQSCNEPTSDRQLSKKGCIRIQVQPPHLMSEDFPLSVTVMATCPHSLLWECLIKQKNRLEENLDKTHQNAVCRFKTGLTVDMDMWVASRFSQWPSSRGAQLATFTSQRTPSQATCRQQQRIFVQHCNSDMPTCMPSAHHPPSLLSSEKRLIRLTFWDTLWEQFGLSDQSALIDASLWRKPL